MRKAAYIIASIVMWVVYAIASPGAGTPTQKHDYWVSQGWCHGVNSSKYMVCHSNSDVNSNKNYIKKAIFGKMPPCTNIFPSPPGPYIHKISTVCIPQ